MTKLISFEDLAQKYWTEVRVKAVTGGKKLVLTPKESPGLLRELGLLNPDASMNRDQQRKYLQINHFWATLEPALKAISKDWKKLRVLDVGCGSAFLTFLVDWGIRERLKIESSCVGIDSSKKLIEKCHSIAAKTGSTERMTFVQTSISSFDWPATQKVSIGTDQDLSKMSQESLAENQKKNRPHVLLALHACDQATDDAIRLAIKYEVDLVAIAPCCQAELAKVWSEQADSKHPFKPMFSNPHLRRELAAHFTDLMRMLVLRSRGYEVTTTEFTMSHSTPKNTLILAVKRGKYLDSAKAELKALVDHLGGFSTQLVKDLETL